MCEEMDNMHTLINISIFSHIYLFMNVYMKTLSGTQNLHNPYLKF